MVTLADIQGARSRIADEVVLTPCARSMVFEDLVPGRLHFKFENFQRTGSFKARGALNRLLLLEPGERERGVVTASAGNHAQAVAYHASRLGISAVVVMPETTPLIKVSNTRRYGAEVILQGSSFSRALEEAERLAADGRVMVHAFDDDAIIAGQGTIGLELAAQLPDLDLVVVPIGGGGVISGIALALRELRPSVRIIGVEAEAAPSARASREAGRIVDVEGGETIADGIAVKRLGERTFPVIEELVEDIVLVSDEEIASAILLLLEREKTVVEGAGATTLAALASGRIPTESETSIAAVLCGGNIDVNIVSRIIDRGLVRDGRLARLVVTVRDRPGALAQITRLVAGTGANVLEVAHHRAFADLSVRDVQIVVQVETRGEEHVQEIIGLLAEAGIPVESAV